MPHFLVPDDFSGPLKKPILSHNNHMEVSLNYCSQNGGNLYRAPYYNIGPRIDSDLGQSPHSTWNTVLKAAHVLPLSGIPMLVQGGYI